MSHSTKALDISWPDCDPINPAIIKLANSGQSETYKYEDTIFKVQDRLDYIYRIQSGSVALFADLENRKTSISEIVFENDLFGFAASGFHDTSAMALSKVKLVAYPIQLVLEAQTSSIPFSTLLLNKQLSRLKKNHRQIHRVSQLTALQAITDYIHELATRESGGIVEGQVISLPLNRFKTADYLGLTFETVSRSFSQLKKMGLIDFSNARSVVVKRSFKANINTD